MAAGKHQHLFAKSRHYVLQMSDSWLHRFCHPTGYRCKVPQLHSSDPFMQNLETGQRKRLQPWIAQAWPSCFLASVFHETLQDTSPLPYQRSLLCSDPAMSRCAVAWARLWRVHRVESYFGPQNCFKGTGSWNWPSPLFDRSLVAHVHLRRLKLAGASLLPQRSTTGTRPMAVTLGNTDRVFLPGISKQVTLRAI